MVDFGFSEYCVSPTEFLASARCRLSYFYRRQKFLSYFSID